MRTDRENVQWRKSSRSGGSGGNCVEVARVGAVVAVRDSKNPDGPVLSVTSTAWRGFIAAISAPGDRSRGSLDAL